MMDLTEDMIRTVAHKVLGTGKVERDGVEIDLDQLLPVSAWWRLSRSTPE